MDLQIFPPLPQFKHTLLHTLWLPQPGLNASIPAGLSPSIMLIVRGSAEVVDENGRRERAPRFILRGPFTAPVLVEYAPDTVTITVCFVPGMFSKICAMEVAPLLNTAIEMEKVFDPQLVAHFLQKIDACCDAVRNVEDFHHFLTQILREDKKNTLGEAFLAAHQKIFFPLMALTAHFGIGERQIERRVRAAFGMNLRELRRLVRFGFTLQRIVNEGSTWGDLTKLALDSGYYDQAHMHKEFSDLAGTGPTQLLQKIAAKDPAYWLYQLNPTQFKDLFMAV